MTTDSKPVKQEVNGTLILPPFSIPWFVALSFIRRLSHYRECPSKELHCVSNYHASSVNIRLRGLYYITFYDRNL